MIQTPDKNRLSLKKKATLAILSLGLVASTALAVYGTKFAHDACPNPRLANMDPVHLQNALLAVGFIGLFEGLPGNAGDGMTGELAIEAGQYFTHQICAGVENDTANK